MKKLEELLLKASRFFGLIMMSLSLLIICILIIVVLVNKGSKLFERTTPSVTFYKSDFVETTLVKDLQQDQVRPDSKVKEIAKDAANRLKPLYEEKLNSYVEKEKENLFRNEETRVKDMADFKDTRVKSFVESTESYIINYLVYSQKEEFYDSYADGLVSYLGEAEKQGVEVFTQNGVPVTTIAYSRVVNKYNQEFNSQKNEITGRLDADTGVASIIGNVFLYLSIGFAITIFLFISMMIAIIRIEDKLKG